MEEEERKAPPPLFLRRLKRKPKCGICFFHKNSKSSRRYCFHRKNVIRGSKKHMWDWEHLLHKTAWKTTKQQHGKTKMLQCMQEGLQATMGQSRLVLGPACSSSHGALGTASSGKGSGRVIQKVSSSRSYLPGTAAGSQRHLWETAWFGIGR